MLGLVLLRVAHQADPIGLRPICDPHFVAVDEKVAVLADGMRFRV